MSSNQRQDIEQYQWLALRSGRYGGVDVIGFKQAGPFSVLAGQTLTCFVDNFPTEEEAVAVYPETDEKWTSPMTAPQVSVAHLPGEVDPVPGGMYPDDYDDGY